jgi:hypothetical protein
LRFKPLLIIIILFLYKPSSAQEYLWPTNASKYLTSSFAEYRPGHFHAGIDIKTWNKVGYKIFAIRDGYIWRIAMSPYGYGKVVYQKLDTGEIAVYAHLLKFNDTLEDVVKKEQKLQGEYRINKYFDKNELPIQKGDIIAFTGSSGIGRPHLHFELRDANNRPLNPFLRGYKVADNRVPNISAISITPLDVNSRVNSDVTPVIFKPTLIRKGEYKVFKEILLWGNIGFAIDCYDRADGVNNTFAIYKLIFYINGELKFDATYNKFSYQTTHLIDFDRDYRLNKRGSGLFQKLYKDKENVLSFYRPFGDDIGVVQCNISSKKISTDGSFANSGPHTFLIEVFDFNGNISTLEGEFYIGKKQRLYSTIYKDSTDHFYLTDIFDEEGNSVDNPRIYLSQNNGHAWKRHFFPKLDSSLDSLENHFRNRYSLNVTNPINILKIIATDKNGNTTFPYYRVIAEDYPEIYQNNDFKIEKDFYDDFIRLQLTVNGIIKDIPRLYMQQMGAPPKEVELFQQEYNEYFGIYQLVPGKDGPVNIEVYAYDLLDQELAFWEQFDIKTISPNAGSKIISKDNKCSVYFPPNSVYNNLFARINENSEVHKDDFVGLAYSLEPFDIPLKKSVIVYLSYPSDDPSPEKLGVYTRKNGRKNWGFVDNNMNPENSTIFAKLSSLQSVTLIRDTIPPEIYVRYPRQNSSLKHRYPTIRAVVKDQLSGIENERSIIMKLDEQKVIAEYDPEAKIIKYLPEEPLSDGNHTVSIWAVDNSGNENSAIHTFTITK